MKKTNQQPLKAVQKRTVQTGNFLLTGETAPSGINYVKAWTASGDWTVTWWENNPLYPLLSVELDDATFSPDAKNGSLSEETEEGIRAFLTVNYFFATQIEGKLLADALEIAQSYFDRLQEKKTEITPGEDSQILETEKTLHEIKEMQQHTEDTP